MPHKLTPRNEKQLNAIILAIKKLKAQCGRHRALHVAYNVIGRRKLDQPRVAGRQQQKKKKQRVPHVAAKVTPKQQQALQQFRFSSTQQQQTRIHFVLDTNVLIQYLYILDDIQQLSVGSVLYLPYMVIKELDILKGRRATGQAARRAIAYLTSKLQQQQNMAAQSAQAEAEHLINVDCPDDSIINCCLQLQQQQRQQLLLLTNDKNLALKALASAIAVTSCQQLIKVSSNWSSKLQQRQQQQRRRRKRR